MVACVTDAIKLLPVALSASGCMQQNPLYAVVDQVKPQLRLVIENGDRNGALHQISILESLEFTKQTLEETRIGLLVNEVRKQTAQNWPDVSKRCRNLIKSWQKIAEVNRPTSSCGNSSNGGTPNLVSPAVRRGLTPGNGVSKFRITSTDSTKGSQNHRIYETGINNGSYAPSQRGNSISPLAPIVSSRNITPPSFHKSASVGTTLSSFNNNKNIASQENTAQSRISPQTNGGKKRKNEETNDPITLTLKRSKSSSSKFGQVEVSPSLSSSGSTSVVSARKDVQSTAELIAQLVSENLPESMTVNLPASQASCSNEASLDGGNFTDSNTQDSINFANSFQKVALTNELSQMEQSKPKRKYTKRAPRFFRNEKSIEADERNANGVSLQTIHESVAEQSTSNDETTRDSIYMDVEEAEVVRPIEKISAKPQHDWYGKLPTMDELKKRCEQRANSIANQADPFMISVGERHVLALPYLEVGSRPDFLEYNFPEPENYYAAAQSSIGRW